MALRTFVMLLFRRFATVFKFWEDIIELWDDVVAGCGGRGFGFNLERFGIAGSNVSRVFILGTEFFDAIVGIGEDITFSEF